MAARKRVIKEDTKVVVMNNSTGSASFENIDGKLVRFPKRGSKKTVKYEDLQNLYEVAYKMIEEGTIIPTEADVIEKLQEEYNVDYNRILKFDEIEEFLAKKSADEIKEFLEGAPKAVQMDVAKVAKDMKIDSKSKTEAIKKATNLDIEDVDK